MAEELGWVIEGDGCYWDGKGVKAEDFASDHNDAIRFARQCDAMTVRGWLLGRFAFALRVTQHVWLAAMQDGQEGKT